MKRISVGVLAGLLATTAIACSSGLSINSDYDPSANFSSFQTYAFAERVPTGDDDPRIYNAIIDGRVKTGVERALAAKGFARVDASPDFLVAWNGAIEGKVSYSTFHDSYGYGWGWYDPYYGYGGPTITTSRTYRNEWDEGMLVIDIVNAASNELVWRGQAQARIDERERSPEEEQTRFDDAIAQILATFPPGMTGS